MKIKHTSTRNTTSSWLFHANTLRKSLSTIFTFFDKKSYTDGSKSTQNVTTKNRAIFLVKKSKLITSIVFLLGMWLFLGALDANANPCEDLLCIVPTNSIGHSGESSYTKTFTDDAHTRKTNRLNKQHHQRNNFNISNETYIKPTIDSRVINDNLFFGIITQPTDQIATIGGNVTYSATADATAIAYQWEISLDAGSTWSPITNGGIYSGATTTTLLLTGVTANEHANQYRLLVTNTNAGNPVTISNEVNLFVRPSINITDISANEGSDLNFNVFLSHAVDEIISFNLNYTNITTDNGDYSPLASFSIPANSTSEIIAIPTIDDTIIEQDETLNVVINNVTNQRATIVDGNGTGTILDNDSNTPTEGVHVSDFTVDEAAGSANFIISYTGNDVQDSFTVDYNITDATATNGTDYTAVASGQLTFPAGTTDGDQLLVHVSITEDVFIEADEDLNIQLLNLSPLLINIVDATGTGTILDNDNAPTKGIDFQNLTVTVTEGDPGASINATFVVEFIGDMDTGETIEVDYLFTNGTAANATDFTPNPTVQTVTFTNLNKTRDIILPIISDNTIESIEDYFLDLVAIRSNVGINLLNNQAKGIILDDDQGSLAVTGFSIVEQTNSINFDVIYTGDRVTGGFTVDYAIVDVTASVGTDYTVSSLTGTLNFTGVNNEAQNVLINVLSDNFIEYDEDLEITISNPSNASSISITTPTATGTIVNDDSGIVSVNGFSENEYNTTANFNLTYTGAPIASGFSVNYTIADISTTSGLDYSVSSQTSSVNFSGTDGEVHNVPIQIIPDALIEGNETLNITINSISQNQITASNPTAVGTIIDIDNVPTAENDSYEVFINQVTANFNVLDNDDYSLDGPAASNPLQMVSNPAHGTVIIRDNATPGDPTDDYFEYEPNPSYNGSDSFRYKLVDANGSEDEAVVNIYVNASNLKKKFEIRYQGSVNGDFTMIANNVLSRTQTGNYNGEDGNHDFADNVFVDIDADPTTFNSTNANLSNPEPGLSCISIQKAFLYWAASDKEYDGTTGGGGIEPTWNYNEVKLMLPGQTTYTTISADDVIYRGRDEHFQYDPYVCVKDITANINALSSPFGTYQVGNVKATEKNVITHGITRTSGTSGGWQIVFVYENVSLHPKNITLYDGYVHTVDLNGIGETEFNFDEFLTIPNGNVNAKVTIGALEGDRDLDGDQLLIYDTTNNWTKLSTTVRGEDNFFSSRITINGLNYVDRSPASTNTLGFDAAVFTLDNIGNRYIDNNQTFARFKIKTDKESYGLYLMGFSVDVYMPSLGPLSLNINNSGLFNASDIVPLTLHVTNSGNDDIQDLIISTILPIEAEFHGANALPTWVTHNYNPTTRELTFNIANGYINKGDDFDINFDVQITEQCYLLETACAQSFEIQAVASYKGSINTSPLTTYSSFTTDSCGTGLHDPTVINVQAPPQVPWATAPNALDRTLSCEDFSALNVANSLEPTTTACHFNVSKTVGSFVPSASCPSEGTYTNTWTFTDACGRVSDTYTQVITLEDNQAPTFNETLPTDSYAAYDNIPVAQILSANDNCDSYSPVNFSETYDGDNSSTSYTIIRTWNTVDCAGNSLSHTQHIYVSKTGNPIGLQISDVTINEDNGTATLEITHTGSVSGGFTIDYSTIDDTAVQLGDYVSASNTINFTGSHNEIRLATITINDDNIIEDTEQLLVQLSNGINTPPINDNEGVITILDNDNIPGVTGISFQNDNIIVNEADRTATIYVQLTGNVQGGFTLNYTTNDATAIQPGDYTTATGTLTFAGNDGEVQPITVSIIDDKNIEDTESLLVDLYNLSTPHLIDINDNQGNISITDNDSDPSIGVQFNINSLTVDEDAGTISLDVVLNRNVQDEFTVEYRTLAVSALNDRDYVGIPSGTQTLTFGGTNPNTQTISVIIIDDVIIENTENFIVLLSNISTSLVYILTNDTAVVNIIDNDGDEPWPTDRTVEACDTIPPAEEITTTSSCIITATLNETVTGDNDSCPTEYTITRTWTITDCVGNTRTHVQVITVVDTVAPTFVEALPQDMTVTCDTVPVADVLTAVDSCNGNVMVTYNETLTNNANCATGYEITRTWTATDCAGNTVDHEQTITIPATGPITPSNYEEEMTILCGDPLPDAPILTFTGGCGDYTVVFNEEKQDASDSDDYMIIRTWDVTDSCGNTASFEQLIFVLQHQLQEITIDICIKDSPIDLVNYLPQGFDTNGTFTAVGTNVVLNGSIFDPMQHQVQTYQVEYSTTVGDCNYFVDFTIAINRDCVPCSIDAFTISKAVTANGDGINDLFEIKGAEYCTNTFNVMIFNRWGNKVYEAVDYKNNWGGYAPQNSLGSSGHLPTGTYYYIIDVIGDDIQQINGYIYLATD